MNITATISKGRNKAQQENKMLTNKTADKYDKMEETRKVRISVKGKKVVDLKA